MNKHSIFVLEAERPAVETYLKTGSVRSINLRALIEVAEKDYGIHTNLCPIDPSPQRTVALLTQLYEKYNLWLTSQQDNG